MREELVERLAEPATGARLRLEATRGTRGIVEEGRLISESSGRAYRIVDGIPRFVEGSTYTDSFGMQWNRFRRAQLDSTTGATHSRDRFDAEAGWSSAELAGKWTLDAGCGAGRFAEIVAARGANLVAMDFSSAVDAAKQTLARFPSVDVVQGNLLEPPFRAGTFDYAYCIGVVQHTPDPPSVIRNVVRCVKSNGEFCFTIYARQPWTKLNAKYLVRPLTRRLPQKTLLRAIETTMPLLFPVAERLFPLPLIGKVAHFTLPIAAYPDRAGFDREQRYQEAILDTFDMLSPRYDQPMTWTEVESALRDGGARSWSFRTRVPVVVTGRR